MTLTRNTRFAALRPRAAVTAVGVVLVAGWLAACKTTETPDTGPYPVDFRDRHPIALREGPRTAELFVGRRRAGLTPNQRVEVAAFAEHWHNDATGGIEIRVPKGTTNERAARETVPEIQSILVATGVPSNGIVVRSSYPVDPSQLAPIVLAYPKVMATAGPCGQWPTDLGPGAGLDYDTNVPYWNLGCSMQRNLAAMVDEPADLVQPRGEIPAYEARRSVVLDKYRKGESTATVNPDADKAKISDVGK